LVSATRSVIDRDNTVRRWDVSSDRALHRADFARSVLQQVGVGLEEALRKLRRTGRG
ncbi:unnamed protein product, partial [Ectocarpus sp. 13 AM-2016]